MIKFIDEDGLIDPKTAASDFGAATAITAFSDFLFDELLETLGAKQIGCITGGVDKPVYGAERNGKRIVVYKSPVGAPAAAMAMEEVGACGVKNFVAFGICGALVNTAHRSFLVPDKAYRDEGTSYHYLAPSDYMIIKNSATVADKLSATGVAATVGGTWTTDGFYRETPTRKAELASKGCIAVDMECSALQAVCDFRGYEFYTFFISADSLADDEWQPNDIMSLTVGTADRAAVAAAIELAFSL